jgi:hypothetical protein
MINSSKLLYDWRFTANQFVLASSTLRHKSNWNLLITILHGPNRKHRFQQYPYCRAFTDPLLQTGSSIACLFVAVRMCLPIRFLETGWITLLFIRLLHSNCCTCYNIISFFRLLTQIIWPFNTVPITNVMQYHNIGKYLYNPYYNSANKY